MVGVYSEAGICLVSLWHLPETHRVNAPRKALSHSIWHLVIPAPKQMRALLEMCALWWIPLPERVHFCWGYQYDSGGWALSVLLAKVFLCFWYLINQFQIQMGSGGDRYSPVPIFTGFLDLSEKLWADYFLTFFHLIATSDGVKVRTVCHCFRSQKDRLDFLHWA